MTTLTRHRYRRFMTLAVVSALATSCGDSGDARGAALAGRTFLSESVTVNGIPQPLVAGTRIRLTFAADRHITVTAGCNTLGGSVRVDDDRLVVGDLGSTEMGCEPALHAQDEWLASIFAANPTYALDGSRLQLRNDDIIVELRDREVADPDRPLQQTVWAVDGLIDGFVVSSIPAEASATVMFDHDEVHVVITSCNDLSGRAKIAPGTIEFERVVMTDIGCAAPATALQAAIAAVLDGKITYALEAASLRLLHPNGKGLTLRSK